ncbi:MAG: glycosyltransferase family 2 protein [Armatimonadota bacterium]|nr:glycosyltransferase family 2 protein [Armatimonadota bacterium]
MGWWRNLSGIEWLAAARFAVLAYNAVRFPILRGGSLPSEVRVSILVPARNEVPNLRRTLPGLLGQGAAEVLVLDDGSEDGTGVVAQEAAGADSRFRLLRSEPLPPGWLGKPWAAWQLAQAAGGDVLVFTDADVQWGPGALGELVQALGAYGLVSVWPRQDVQGILLGSAVSFLLNGAFGFLPHGVLRRLGLANGQVLAVRREAYFRAGGHRAVRDPVLEDVALARRFRQFGLFQGVCSSGLGCTGRTGRWWRGSARTSSRCTQAPRGFWWDPWYTIWPSTRSLGSGVGGV